MGLYRRFVIPLLDESGLDRPDVRRLRVEACAVLVGDVVEIGFGSGLNVPHYPAGVRRVLAVEPAAQARRRAARRIARGTTPVVFEGDDAQHLPFADATADSALVTWTLCAIDDPAAAARELLRVLRPGAPLAYLEHGASPDPAVLRRQRRLDRVYHAVGGCHLDRVAPDVLAGAGFVLERQRSGPMPGTPRLSGHVYQGVARKPARSRRTAAG